MNHEANGSDQPLGPVVPGWKPPPFPSREPMEGRFCVLEPLDPERHAADLHRACALDRDGRNWSYLPYGPFESPESYRAWMSETCLGQDPMFFAIVDKETGSAVGVCSYLRIDPRAGSIEVGHLNYSPLLQKKPAATEAMVLMMERAFGTGYRRYEWKCNALNAASRAAAQRLGFSFEGLFRQASVVKGRNRDTAWYSVIDAEWPLLRSAFDIWLSLANFDENGMQKTRLSELTRPLLARPG